MEDANVISLALPPPIRHRSSNIFTTAQQKIKSNSNFVPDRESLHDEAPVLGRNDQMVPKRVPNVAQMSKFYLHLLIKKISAKVKKNSNIQHPR